MPELAAGLTRRKVSVIVGPDSTSAVKAAQKATATIPIVFRIGTEPIKEGFVASLNRPGGNLTGLTTLGVGLMPKRLELLREIIGTIVLLQPLTRAANEWIAANLPADRLHYAGAVVIEPRYLADIVGGIRADGLEVS